MPQLGISNCDLLHLNPSQAKVAKPNSKSGEKHDTLYGMKHAVFQNCFCTLSNVTSKVRFSKELRFSKTLLLVYCKSRFHYVLYGRPGLERRMDSSAPPPLLSSVSAAALREFLRLFRPDMELFGYSARRLERALEEKEEDEGDGKA